MTRIEEIEAMLEVRHNPRDPAQEDEDIAYLLAEVKRLEGESVHISAYQIAESHARMYAAEGAQMKQLALSLAEALEFIRDHGMSSTKELLVNEAGKALSSPALLKVKGGL